MNEHPTPEELDAALCVGLNNTDPGVKSQEFDEACKVIAKIKKSRSVMETAAGILANEVRRLQADNDRLENSIAEWQNSYGRLYDTLLDVGLCPICNKEFISLVSGPGVSCACGPWPWRAEVPLILKLRQEIETLKSQL